MHERHLINEFCNGILRKIAELGGVLGGRSWGMMKTETFAVLGPSQSGAEA